MKKKNIKQHIIDTASRLFYANGYQNTGINEIVAKADIAKATLYHHFSSKEEICKAHLNLRHQSFIDGLQISIGQKSAGREQVLAIFDYLRDEYRKDDFNGCWALKVFSELTPNEKDLHLLIQQQKTELLKFIKGLIEAHYQVLSKAEAEQLSETIYLLYEGAVTESRLHQNDWPIHNAKSVAAKLVDGYVKN